MHGNFSRVYHPCRMCRTVIIDEGEEVLIPTLGYVHNYCMPLGHVFRREKEEGVVEGVKKKEVKILFLENWDRKKDLFEKLDEWREIYPEISPEVVVRNPAEVLSILKKEDSYWDFLFIDAHDIHSLKGIVDEVCATMIPPRVVVFYGHLSGMELRTFEEYKTRMELKGVDVKKIPLFQLVFSPIREKRQALLPPAPVSVE